MKSASIFATLTLLALAVPCQGYDWASELFESRTHDFGTVARAAKTEHVFEFENRTDQPIQISHVRASCGCTTPIVPEKTVAPGAKGKVIARFNTGSFVGQRGATLTVVFNRPTYREVQLRVDGYVRRDIVCNPGSIEFGQTQESQVASKEISIQYAGRNDWQITDVTSEVPGLEFELKETRRGNGRVGYSLLATWQAESAGYLQTDVVLKTNDSRRPTIPLSVTGQSISTLQVSPANLYLGQIAPGQAVTKRVIVRANDEFRLTGVNSEDSRVTVNFDEEAKKIQMVELTFVADEKAGEFQAQVMIETDAGDNAKTNLVVSGMINTSLALEK